MGGIVGMAGNFCFLVNFRCLLFIKDDMKVGLEECGFSMVFF